MQRKVDTYEPEECTMCGDLVENRSRIVNGQGGGEGCSLMLIGEGPGKTEDQQGNPFVGKSGKKLRKHLHRLGVEKEDARITNMVRCRPPGNRDPKKEEMWACAPYLRKEIKYFGPDVLCTLGAVPSREMLGQSVSMKAHSGRVFEKKPFDGMDVEFKVVPSYHPAAMFYSSGDKIENKFEEAVRKAVEISIGVEENGE